MYDTGKHFDRQPEIRGGDAPVDVPVDLLERIVWEADRCQRYNHYFSLLLVTCRPADRGTAQERMQGQLRTTDSVHQVRSEGVPAGDPAAQCWVGAILPETGAAGAEAAVSRLNVLLSDVADAKLGFVVYPDDGTEPGPMLQAAVDSSTGGGRQQKAIGA